MKKDLNYFKNLLEEEKKTLEAELSTVGQKNPADKNDWIATDTLEGTDTAEEGELADNIDEYENKIGILDKLEPRLNEVVVALKKISDGTYGKCEVCGGEIEDDRLEANPAAETCKVHME